MPGARRFCFRAGGEGGFVTGLCPRRSPSLRPFLLSPDLSPWAEGPLSRQAEFLLKRGRGIHSLPRCAPPKESLPPPSLPLHSQPLSLSPRWSPRPTAGAPSQAWVPRPTLSRESTVPSF